MNKSKCILQFVSFLSKVTVYIHQLQTSFTSDIFEPDSHSCAQKMPLKYFVNGTYFCHTTRSSFTKKKGKQEKTCNN